MVVDTHISRDRQRATDKREGASWIGGGHERARTSGRQRRPRLFSEGT